MEGQDSDSSPVTREDEDEISECYSKWRSRLFFIEIQMTLVLLLYMNSAQLVQQYIFQRIARETLAHTPNYTAPNHSICLDQDYIVNNTGSNESIIKIQKEANDLAMYLEVIRLGMSAVTALFYGSLSDIFGRKPILALCLLGLSLCCGVQVAVIELNLNMHIYLLVAAGINGLFGGFASIVGVCFAAVSDVATKKWRTLRMSTTESAIGFGKLSSYLVVYYWIDNNGCDFRLPAYSMLGIALVAFIYLLLLPESLPPKENRKEGGFKKLLDGTKLFVLPSRLSFSKWWRLWICVIILTIQCFCSVGIAQVINYFLHNKPLEWSYDIIGIYGVVAAISHIITLVAVLPLLLALPLPEGLLNPIIIIFGAIVGVGTNVMMATVKTDWEMFLAGTVQTIQQIAFPTSNSILAGLVKSEDYGAVLTITASLQIFASAGAAVLFNEVYHPEAEVNGRHYNAGLIFWITAGLWVVMIPLTMLLFKKSGTTKTNLLNGSKNQKNYKAIN